MTDRNANPDPTPGMVSSAFPLATEAGCAVLRKGGNAVDAAVATAWALSVCEPGNSGLGGRSLVLLRRASGETLVLDANSNGPASASLDAISPKQQRTGPRATTVPSTPAVLGAVHERYGRLSRQAVLEPAIDLAESGYLMTELQHKQLKWCLHKLAGSPTGSRFFLSDGKPVPVGRRFRQPELAAALRRLAEFGVEDFYSGEIAQAIDDDMKSQGGLIALDDLGEVAISEREPLVGEFEGFDLLTSPPPAGGFLVLLGLEILGRLHLESTRDDPLLWYSMLGETIHAVYSARERLPLRLDEFDLHQLEDLLEGLAGELGDSIRENTYQPTPGSDREEAGETTHLCAVDGDGTVVSLTQSIQSLYGSKSACSRYGFLYNNYLVTCPREPHPHQLGSRCQPRSNSAPSLLLPHGSDSGAYLTFGAAGSRRSISAVLHTLSGVFDLGLPLEEAVALPRIHVKQSRRVWLEKFDEADELARRAEHQFGEVEIRKRFSYAMGCLQAIQRSDDGQLSGAADPRREGTAEEVLSE